MKGSLVAGIELLCLDAGNTVIFLDHDRLARLIGEATNVHATADALIVAEGEAKRLAEDGGLVDPSWSFRDRPGAISWGKMVATIALRAGVAPDALPALLDHVWRDHEAKNLWWKVPPGLDAALDEIRELGVKVAIISNSEGMLERLFEGLGLLPHLDLIVDSGRVGVEKPDPRIFQIAFERFGVVPANALHLGDMYTTDILGARAAGCRYAFVDPFGHWASRHPDVPRVAGATEVARAIADDRRTR